MNRSLAVKFDRAKTQRIAAGITEGTKHAYIACPKAAVRDMLATVQLMPKNCNEPKPEPSRDVMVLYNPRIHRAKPTLATRAQVDFEPFLVKRG
jgi:hypothetical protein